MRGSVEKGMCFSLASKGQRSTKHTTLTRLNLSVPWYLDGQWKRFDFFRVVENIYPLFNWPPHITKLLIFTCRASYFQDPKNRACHAQPRPSYLRVLPFCEIPTTGSLSTIYQATGMASLHLCCVLWTICCLLSVVNTLWDRRGAVEVERRDSHRLYPPRNFPGNLSYAFHFATDKVVSALDMAVQQLNTYHRPLLVHTRDEVRRCW